MQSTIQKRGAVDFPAFMGERIYMREFTRRKGLPLDLRRWQVTIDAMLDGVEANGPIYLMVDEGFVNAGSTHRRGGLHVDGRWIPATASHGSPRPHHAPLPEPAPLPPYPQGPRHLQMRGSHGHRFEGRSELIVFASNVMGCRAWVGEYEGAPAEDGDCSLIGIARMAVVNMEPDFVWAGNALTTIHESIPVRHDCLRTMVRLNVPIV